MSQRVHIVLALFALLATAACGLDDDGPGVYQPPQDSGIKDPNKNPNPNDKVKPPSVDPLSNSTCAPTVPLSGTGTVGTSILVKGGSEDISTDANSVTGRFCVDVKLYKNTTNTLKVYTLDPDLGLSTATVVSIQQTSTGCTTNPNPNPTPTEKSKNQAVGAKVKAEWDPESGKVTAITDGSSTTSARFSGGWLGVGAGLWIMVDLGKTVEVDKVVVKWLYSSSTTDKYYGMEYKLLTALAGGDPGTPDASTNNLWSEAASITSGDGGDDTFQLKSKGLMVQYVAILLEQDGASWTWTETFDLAEIEVWDVPKSGTTTTTPTYKTCSSTTTTSF